MFLTQVLPYLSGLILHILWIASVGWSAYQLLARFGSAQKLTVAVRLSYAALLSYWIFGALLLLLTQLGWFRIPQFTAAVGLLLLVTHISSRTSNPFQLLRNDTIQVRQFIHELPRSNLRLFLVVCIPITVARILRGLIRPPLAWDALTYHLVKAAQWAQTGQFITERAPDAWSYYEYFPPIGDGLWSTSMLATQSDALLIIPGLLIWITILLGGYTLIRELGGERHNATLGAFAIAFTPAIANLLNSCYVDNIGVAAFLLAMLACTRYLRGGQPLEAGLAVLGLGFLCGIKSSFLPALFIGIPVLFAATITRAPHRKAGTTALLAGALSMIVPLYAYFRAYRDTGNPLYPMALSIPGLPHLAGNPEFAAVHYASTAYHQGPDTRGRFPQFLWYFFFEHDLAHQEMLQFTWMGLLIIAVSLYVIPLLLRDKQNRSSLIFVLTCALLLALPFMLPSTRHYRAIWYSSMGRLLSASFAVLIVCVAAAPSRLARPTLFVALAVFLLYSIPLGWSLPDLSAALWLAPAALCFLSILVIPRFRFLQPTAHRRLTKTAAALGSLLLLALLPITRARLRYDYYSAVPIAFDMHMLEPRFCSPATWRLLDDGKPHRIAFCAGWSYNGHNWYRYPLFGSHLQNTVSYIPISSDGAIHDELFTNPADVANYQAWVARLKDQKIEYVVGGVPPPYEDKWMYQHSEQFQLVIQEHFAGKIDGRTYRLL